MPMRERTTGASTIAVLGAGHVGAAVTSSLTLLGVAERLVLYDRHRERAEGEAWDIDDTTPLFHEVEIVATDDYRDLATAAVAVITVGANVKVGQSRLDVLAENAGLLRSVMGELDRAAPEAAVIIASNPVDVLTRLAIECSSRPERLIVGSGTVVDSARLRFQLATAVNADPADTHAYVLGEHGETQFVAWSSAAIGAIPLAQYPLPAGTALAQIREQCETTTRDRGGAIHARKGFTSYGVAGAVCRLAASILRDEGRIYTTSARALPEYRVGTEVVLGLPCTVGAGGITRRLVLPLDGGEQTLLEKSAAALTAAYRSLA